MRGRRTWVRIASAAWFSGFVALLCCNIASAGRLANQWLPAIIARLVVVTTGQSLGQGGNGTGTPEAGSPDQVPGWQVVPFTFGEQIGDSTGVYDYADTGAPSLYRAPWLAAIPNVDAQSSAIPSIGVGNAPDVRMARAASLLFAQEGLPGYLWSRENECIGGTDISSLAPGSLSFEAGIANLVSYCTAPTLDAGLPVLMGAYIIDHGQNNCNQGPGWLSTVKTMATTMVAQAKATTHQTRPIPTLVLQQHSRCIEQFSSPNINGTAAAAWQVMEESWNCGPASTSPLCYSTTGTYWYQTNEGTHHSFLGSQQVGAWEAKWMTRAEKWQQGGPWPRPLAPTSIAYNAGTFTATVPFNVNSPPMVFDDSFGVPHQSGVLATFANGHGFELWKSGNPNGAWIPLDGGGGVSPVTIVSATITGGNTLNIVGASAWDWLCYAMTPDDQLATDMTCPFGVNAQCTGHTGYPWGSVGSVRDSDTTQDPISGALIPDWSVAFCIANTWSGAGNGDAGPW